ncbi:MAG: hypothetical protein KF836_10735 [Fimbriimonadaceae bacterium]|nr:hypothetical protein [Fimbriimonadaceae bacterium]
MAQETIKEDTLQKQKSALPMIWLAAGAAVGLGAAAWFLKTRQGKALPWDADKLIDACDAAAAKLDEILFTESRQVG